MSDGPSSLAKDHIDQLSQLQGARLDFDAAWRQARIVAAPEASDFLAASGGSSNIALSTYQKADAARNSVKLYDSTAVWCVDRLASGIESLVAPQAETWHGLTTSDLTKRKPDQAAKLWFEDLTSLMFQLRYDPDANFIPTLQTAIRRCITFGNAFFELEDGVSGESFFRYSYVPLNECYAATDKYDKVDVFHRLYTKTARQAVQEFGTRVSPIIQRAAESPTDSEKKFTFLKCVAPRAEYGRFGRGGGVRDAAFACYHIEVETRTIVKESGFYEFPIIDFRWMPEPGRVYGEGPIMKCLADIQSLNEMAKNELIMSQQAAQPPLLVANAGVMNRPRTDPGAINLGGINSSGQRMIEPMNLGQRPDFASQVIEAKRNAIKESLYINLFAILIRNPEMSATEAMIRSNEKGELLGPAGSRFQVGLHRMVSRELGILERRGAFAQSSAYAPPPQLQNRKIAAQSTSPLDRYRRGKEVEGSAQLLNMIAPLAQVDQEVADRIDADKMIVGLSERLGVPLAFMRDDEAVANRRAARQQNEALAQQASAAKDLASASKTGVEALAAGQQSGII